MPETPPDLADRTIVITGSTRGIGRAMARELARAGAAVVVHGHRSREAGESLLAELLATGTRATALWADLADPAGRQALVEQSFAWTGRVDCWINNAGVDVLTGPAARWSFAEKLSALWQLDVVATLELSRAVGRRMQAQGAGSIINVGWDQAAWGMAGDSGELFATSKGAIMAMTKSLALSLAPQVRVNCLAPGWIRTAWGESAPAEWQARARRESLAGRWGEPDDVARAARFLASPDASYLSGQVLAVNGGFRPPG